VAKFVAETGPAFFAGRYNIGSWWWELPEFPEIWAGAFRHFDEIWAGTQFIASAIAMKSPIPVVLVPPVVSIGSVRGGRKSDFGIADDETMFLFVFDFLSVFARKNPLGVVEAFRRAFPGGTERVRLVIKTINGEYDPANRARLAKAAGADARIGVIDEYFSRGRKNELLGACDAYISLHRSEGFGYTLAEAMALGKPVIGTAWSGPADFMTTSNSFPVRYDIVELTDDHGPYSAGQRNPMWTTPRARCARFSRIPRRRRRTASARARTSFHAIRPLPSPRSRATASRASTSGCARW
jgi:glycosyltransferase involved in cell wall biosynthesis